MTGFVLARVRRGLLLAGLVFAALPVGSALADTTIGQTGTGVHCVGPGVLGDKHYVVPAGGGTITSFSFQGTSANNGEQTDFMVLRPVSATTYTVVGKTGLVPLAGTGLETFPASIDVQSGDILGLWVGIGHDCAFPQAGGGVVVGTPGADPNVGDPINLLYSTSVVDLNESANLVTDSDLALAQPSDKTVNATSPAGAVVTYTSPAATDESLATVTVGCLPASGSTFAIGDTTVTCTATDTDGDSNSPVQKTFNVHVKGAAQQLTDLGNAVKGVGPGTSLADKVASVQSYLAAHHTSDACGALNAFINQVKAQSGKSIPAGTATTLIGAARQIEAVIPCTS